MERQDIDAGRAVAEHVGYRAYLAQARQERQYVAVGRCERFQDGCRYSFLDARAVHGRPVGIFDGVEAAWRVYRWTVEVGCQGF